MSSSRTEHPSMNAFSLVTVPRCCLAQHPALSGIPPGPHSLRQEPAIRAGLAGDSWSRLPLGRAEAEVLSQVWWVRPRPHLDTGLTAGSRCTCWSTGRKPRGPGRLTTEPQQGAASLLAILPSKTATDGGGPSGPKGRRGCGQVLEERVGLENVGLATFDLIYYC